MGNTRRMLAATAASAFLALGTLAGAAAPATADVGPGPSSFEKKTGEGPEACPEDRYCLYDLPNFNKGVPTGEIWAYRGTYKNLHITGGGDRADSVYNNTDDTISVYRDWLYSTTQCLLLPPYSVHADLNVHDMVNAISSASTLPALQCRS